MQAFRTMWLLCNLNLDSKLCLHDDKNDVYVHHILRVNLNINYDYPTLSHISRIAVSDCLNSQLFGYIVNLA